MRKTHVHLLVWTGTHILLSLQIPIIWFLLTNQKDIIVNVLFGGGGGSGWYLNRVHDKYMQLPINN